MFEANKWFKESQKLLKELDIQFTNDQNLELYAQFIKTWGEVQISVLSSMQNLQIQQPQQHRSIGYNTELLEVGEED